MALRYFFRPYKTKEEEEEYKKGYKETRLTHVRAQGRKAGKGIRPKGRGVNWGFSDLVNIGQNVNRNIESEQGNFGFGFGSEKRKAPARHHRPQYRRVRVRPRAKPRYEYIRVRR